MSAPAALTSLLDATFADPQPAELAVTKAAVVVHRGEVVAERYGPDTDADTTLISWSMAKSFLHAVVGICVRDGLLDVDEPAPVPEWQSPDDPRRAITVRHLLQMRDGLDFVEDYEDPSKSSVIPMLFGEGKADVAAFAADRPLRHPPGEVFSYSSGTSNVLARIVADALGRRGDELKSWMASELFEPLGMTSATIVCDDAGVWVASSYVYATARDFARFGELYLGDGVWDDQRLLPSGWVGEAHIETGFDADDARWYGHHWWIPQFDRRAFYAGGFLGQRILVCPGRDLVVCRLGETPDSIRPLDRWFTELVAHFPHAD